MQQDWLMTSTSEVAAARPCLRAGTLAGGMAPLSLEGSSSATAPSFLSLSMRSRVASLACCAQGDGGIQTP